VVVVEAHMMVVVALAGLVEAVRDQLAAEAQVVQERQIPAVEGGQHPILEITLERVVLVLLF
jgi:hypothetical protein